MTRTTHLLLAGMLSGLFGCDGGSPSGADQDGPDVGGKADDGSAACQESPGCYDGMVACFENGGERESCESTYAACLVVAEGAAPVDCEVLDGDFQIACSSCGEVPECETVEDGADANRCLGATAACVYEVTGLVPDGWCSPEFDASPSADWPCNDQGCTERFMSCSVSEADPEECEAGFASCLAVEGAPLLSCDDVSAEDAGVCDSCFAVPECDVVEHGADNNSCISAVAVCQYETLGLLPGYCEVPALDFSGDYEGAFDFQCEPRFGDLYFTIDEMGVLTGTAEAGELSFPIRGEVDAAGGLSATIDIVVDGESIDTCTSDGRFLGEYVHGSVTCASSGCEGSWTASQ